VRASDVVDDDQSVSSASEASPAPEAAPFDLPDLPDELPPLPPLNAYDFDAPDLTELPPNIDLAGWEDIAGLPPMPEPGSLASIAAAEPAPAQASTAGDLFGNALPKVDARKDSTKPAKLSQAEADAAFARFWSLYPKHVAKDAARRAFATALRKASVGDIMAGLERSLPVFAGKERQFIKNPATWLNGGCWTDEHEQPAQAAAKRQSFDPEADPCGVDAFLAGLAGVEQTADGPAFRWESPIEKDDAIMIRSWLAEMREKAGFARTLGVDWQRAIDWLRAGIPYPRISETVAKVAEGWRDKHPDEPINSLGLFDKAVMAIGPGYAHPWQAEIKRWEAEKKRAEFLCQPIDAPRPELADIGREMAEITGLPTTRDFWDAVAIWVRKHGDVTSAILDAGREYASSPSPKGGLMALETTVDRRARDAQWEQSRPRRVAQAAAREARARKEAEAAAAEVEKKAQQPSLEEWHELRARELPVNAEVEAARQVFNAEATERTMMRFTALVDRRDEMLLEIWRQERAGGAAPQAETQECEVAAPDAAEEPDADWIGEADDILPPSQVSPPHAADLRLAV
jgi:hypothetical protein